MRPSDYKCDGSGGGGAGDLKVLAVRYEPRNTAVLF